MRGGRGKVRKREGEGKEGFARVGKREKEDGCLKIVVQGRGTV